MNHSSSKSLKIWWVLFAAYAICCFQLGLAAFDGSKLVVDIDKEICQKPNENTTLCHVPTDSTSSCANLNPNVGAACSLKVYEIKNFPDGTQTAASGTTSEELADCWRSHECRVDNTQNPPKCVTDPNGWGGWHSKAKVKVGSGICPLEPR